MTRPQSEEDLVAMIRSATGPLRVIGGGTRGIVPPEPAQPLETGGLAGITLYEPGALTMVARAGTPLNIVEVALAAEGQRLAFEPTDLRGLLGTSGMPTIGGVFAANSSGPRRAQSGAARDHLLGVRFVDGSGTVIRNGGRVMKNVTGYDLVKLLAGSYGTLGVLTEVSFKVLPAPEAISTVFLSVTDPAGAVAAMSAALGSPFDVSGAAWTGEDVAIRIEGFENSVAYRTGRLEALLSEHGAVRHETDTARVTDFWRRIRDVSVFEKRAGDVWKVSCRASAAPGLIARMGAEATFLDWGGGLVWALTEPGVDLRARMGLFDGHATRVRMSAAAAGGPRFHPQTPALAGLAQALRTRFDPKGLFNRGIME